MVAMVVVALVVADDLEEFDRMMAEPRDRWDLVVNHGDRAPQGGLGGPPGHGAGGAGCGGLCTPAGTVQVSANTTGYFLVYFSVFFSVF